MFVVRDFPLSLYGCKREQISGQALAIGSTGH